MENLINEKHFRYALFAALAMTVFPFPASAAYSIKDTAEMSGIVNGLACTWTAPIGSNTNKQDDGGPIIGNGGYGIAVGGTANNLRLWMSESGMFSPGAGGGNGVITGDYRGMGYVNISANGNESGGGSYTMHQYLRQAYVTTAINMNGQTINGKIWISDSDNVAFCELTNAGSSAASLKAVLVSYDGDAAAGSTGGDSVAWISKDLSGQFGAVRYAMAMKRVDGAGSVSAATGGSSTLAFTINAGQTATLVFKVADNWKGAVNPIDTITPFIRSFAANDAWWANHERYWDNFWYKSYVKFSNHDVERWWYGHLYWLASGSRQGPTNYAPVTWGIWTRGITSDWAELWGNYNGEAPFYGMGSSNHLEVLQPYAKAIALHQSYAVQRVAYCNAHPTDAGYMGANVRSKMPAVIHGGLNNGIFNGRGVPGWGNLLGGLIWNQPTDGVNQLTPAVDYYKYSMSNSFYTDTLYGILKNQADLLTDYIHNIGKVNGKYQIWGSAHEDNWCQNSTYDIEWVQYLMKEMMAASIAQNKDAASRPIWQGIIDSLEPVLTTTRNGQAIISESVEHPTWSDGNLNCVLQFVAAGGVSASSSPVFLEAIRNTLQQTNSWGGGNAYCTVTSMGARSFYDPDFLIQKMTNRTLLTSLHTNDGGAGGMEVCGLIDGINSLVLQSHDGIIRIFPNCPKTLDAKFQGLRAHGAFLVEAHHTAGNTIDDAVYIYSEAGKPCSVKNPWPGEQITVVTNGVGLASTNANDIYTFNTVAGQTYQIKHGVVSARNPGLRSPAASLKFVGITARKSDVVIVFKGSGIAKEYAVSVYALNGDKVYAANVPNSGTGAYSVTWKSGTSSGSFIASIRSGSSSIEKRFTLK